MVWSVEIHFLEVRVLWCTPYEQSADYARGIFQRPVYYPHSVIFSFPVYQFTVWSQTGQEIVVYEIWPHFPFKAPGHLDIESHCFQKRMLLCSICYVTIILELVQKEMVESLLCTRSIDVNTFLTSVCICGLMEVGLYPWGSIYVWLCLCWERAVQRAPSTETILLL